MHHTISQTLACHHYLATMHAQGPLLKQADYWTMQGDSSIDSQTSIRMPSNHWIGGNVSKEVCFEATQQRQQRSLAISLS